MKSAKAILLFVFTWMYILTCKATDCEKKYLIDKYHSANKETNEQLSTINQLTLEGKYEEAKKIIRSIKNSSANNTSLFGTTIIYEANICYNQSNYNRCVVLCDSALQLIRGKQLDGYEVKAMNLKAKAIASQDKFDEALSLLNSTRLIAKKNNDTYGIGINYYLRGSALADKGMYDASVKQFDSSLTIRKEIEDEIGEAACYSFLGLNESFLGNYSAGISYIQKSIAIRERIGDKRGLANSYLNLYKIYFGMGEINKALQSEFKSLEICTEINDLQCISGRYTNIGQLYQNKGEYTKALEYQYKALEICTRIGLKNRAALVHENIARVYLKQNLPEKAVAHLDTSFTVREELGDKEGLASTKLVYAMYYLHTKKFDQALHYAALALKESESLQLPTFTKDAHEILSNAYSGKNNAGEAFHHYKEFIALRDSLYNIDKTKEITRKELEFDFAKKEQAQKLEQEKELNQIQKETEQQRFIRNVSIAFSIIVGLFLLIALRENRIRRKTQKELEQVNTSLSFTNQTLTDKNSTIELQKQMIEQKNREITDSIQYAYNIQTAIMPSEEEFAEHFAEGFVFFQPKDIISGDFYWISKINNKIIYATGDCTGHGVPGGFMSMLGISLLNEIVNEHELTEPALILSRLRKKVIAALKQKGISGEHQDGMDMIVCVIDKETNSLTFASANRPFYLVSEGLLKEFKGDKQPVGIFGKELKPFTQQKIELKNKDLIYTFTDGYADQFGGPKGKKFKYKQLQELLLKHNTQPLHEQQSAVASTFKNWKGNLEQVDDVCIIGVRISV